MVLKRCKAPFHLVEICEFQYTEYGKTIFVNKENE